MMWNDFLPDNNSKVTVELREIVNSGIDIWDFDYPSYYTGEAKRAFEQKVIDHYALRQIGQETVGRWLHYFRTRVREIMPYYIQRYKSVEMMDKIEDPFESYNLTEVYTQERVGTGSVSGESEVSAEEKKNGGVEDNKTRRFSNTPQGSISNLDKYLTEATVEDNDLKTEEDSESKSTGSTKQSSTDSESTNYTLTRRGNIGVSTLGQEINSLRASYINVDMEVINELKDLFLLIY